MDIKNAKNLISKAQEKALELNLNICVSIVDTHGFLVAFEKMDNAMLGSIEVSFKKAKTAALFRKDSAELGKKMIPGEGIVSIENTHGGLLTFGGGKPVYNSEAQVIGAIGISGGSVDQDVLIAEFALS